MNKMKKYIYKISLTSIFLSLFMIQVNAQEGFFGKKLSIQANGIYHRYSETYLANGGGVGDSYYVLNFIKPASIRIISPELSLNYAYAKRKSIRLGFKEKRTPVLQTLKGDPLDLNIYLPQGAELSKNAGIPIQTIFFEYRKFNKYCDAPIGAYKGIGLEYNMLRNFSSLGEITLNNSNYPIELADPMNLNFLGLTINAGRNIPLTNKLLLNLDCRFVLPLISRYNYSLSNNPLYFELDNSSEIIRIREIDINPNDILFSRLRLISELKLNFSIGIHYMII
jgi:hypothetical protein